jgi:lipoyl(octanoyl) transferase
MPADPASSPADTTTRGVAVRDLGVMEYEPALAVQREANRRLSVGDGPHALLLVEHPPVITVSRRRGAAEHLVADRATLDRLGIAVHQTDRGGDITYHGPGQLVVYPIVRLDELGLSLGGYMRALESALIDAAAGWGVTAHRVDGCTGVWVAPPGSAPGRGAEAAEQPGGAAGCASAAAKKLAALGVRVRKHTTLHGLALNVTTDLSHFETIVPCGLAGRGVTSLRKLLGDRCPAMATVKRDVVHHLRRVLELDG